LGTPRTLPAAAGRYNVAAVEGARGAGRLLGSLRHIGPCTAGFLALPVVVVGCIETDSPPGHPENHRDRNTGQANEVSKRTDSPRISVITPCLNGASYIGEAIESVLRQRYPDTEHIVADGGSTDGTLQLLGLHPHVKI